MRQSPTPNARELTLPSLVRAFTDRWACQPVIGVRRQKWRMDDEHATYADVAFAGLRDQVLKRDNFSCRFCSFKAAKFQQIHHFDGDHQNNVVDNLLTACNLCHQVHHLGMAGQNGAGFLAPLPEITQAEVNHLSRAHFVGELVNDQAVKDKLTGLYASFRARADNLKSAFGADVSSPTLFAQVLSVCDERIFAERSDLMSSFRLVPTKAAFQAGQLEYHAVNAKLQFQSDSWVALGRELSP